MQTGSGDLRLGDVLLWLVLLLWLVFFYWALVKVNTVLTVRLMRSLVLTYL